MKQVLPGQGGDDRADSGAGKRVSGKKGDSVTRQRAAEVRKRKQEAARHAARESREAQEAHEAGARQGETGSDSGDTSRSESPSGARKPSGFAPDPGDMMGGAGNTGGARSPVTFSGASGEKQAPAVPAFQAPARPPAPDITPEDQLWDMVDSAGVLLTAPDAPLERKGELRDIVALFETGLYVVSKSHLNDPRVLSFASYARRQRFVVDDPVAVDLSLVRKIYDRVQGRLQPGMKADSTPMQREIMRFVVEAVRQKASDAHIKVERDHTTVRLRVNGIMQDLAQWPAKYGDQFCAAVFAGADTSDSSYQPFEYQPARIAGKEIKLPAEVQAIRCQFNPVAHGGRYLVMRFLYTASIAGEGLENLGYFGPQLRLFELMRRKPLGINIICGPTGSGKSTTLQRSLSMVMSEKRHEVNILTVEDPPEYIIKGAAQMPVVNAATPDERRIKFVQAINASLRSDPDVIMIGEVRDLESARLAFEGAMTGHQIWTSLHANDAITALARLRDIGVEDYKLFDPTIVTGLVSQRLVRRLCDHCAMPLALAHKRGEVDDRLMARVEAVSEGNMANIRARGQGCEHCEGSGYAGRTVIAEVIMPDETFMDLMRVGNKSAARTYWMENQQGIDMMAHAIYKMLEGEVSPLDVELQMGPLPVPEDLE